MLCLFGVRPVIVDFCAYHLGYDFPPYNITILFAAAGQLWLVNPSTVNISNAKDCLVLWNPEFLRLVGSDLFLRRICQGFGSVGIHLIRSGSGSSILGWILIRIRIQGSMVFMTQNLKKIDSWKKLNFFESKTTILHVRLVNNENLYNFVLLATIVFKEERVGLKLAIFTSLDTCLVLGGSTTVVSILRVGYLLAQRIVYHTFICLFQAPAGLDCLSAVELLYYTIKIVSFYCTHISFSIHFGYLQNRRVFLPAVSGKSDRKLIMQGFYTSLSNWSFWLPNPFFYHSIFFYFKENLALFKVLNKKKNAVWFY